MSSIPLKSISNITLKQFGKPLWGTDFGLERCIICGKETPFEKWNEETKAVYFDVVKTREEEPKLFRIFLVVCSEVCRLAYHLNEDEYLVELFS